MKRTPIKRKSPLKTRTALRSVKVAQPGRRCRKSGSVAKQTPIRSSARGEPCLVCIPGICNGDPQTTVLAHLNGAGIGRKAPDHEAAYACSACHQWLDGGYAQTGYNRDTRDLWHLQGVIRTQRRLIDKGLLVVHE